MAKQSISNKDIKILWGPSGKKCAQCHINLIEKELDGSNYVVGQMAHIEGENPNSARYNPKMTDKERCNNSNLILLCPTCHVKIDNDIKKYTVDVLKKIKFDHETWVEQSLKDVIIDVTFEELDVILKHLTSTPITDNQDPIVIVPPKDKINKNKLSSKVENLIIAGLSQVKLIQKYLATHQDIGFNQRLRSRFVEKYLELKHSDKEGDELFYSLLEFTYTGYNFTYQAAALSVLVYFFEICDIFEK